MFAVNDKLDSAAAFSDSGTRLEHYKITIFSLIRYLVYIKHKSK